MDPETVSERKEPNLRMDKHNMAELAFDPGFLAQTLLPPARPASEPGW